MKVKLTGFLLIAPFLLVADRTISAQSADWLQWGGPKRNFTSPSKGLASVWPETGPKRLWARELGDGHSSIIVDGPTIYTMYSKANTESLIAMEAATGKTLWEHKNEFSAEGLDFEYGRGPHSTPLIVGDRIFTTGTRAVLNCHYKRTGKLIWSHDLYKEYKGTFEDRGYACSPVAYKNTIIISVGGQGQALMAFDQKDGSVVWKKHDFMTSPNSHIIINVDGQDQLVAFLGKFIIGVDPGNGDLLWSHPHETEWGLNISTPVWGEGNLLFCSSAYNGGSRVLKPARAGGKTNVTEVWFHRRLRLHHSNAMRIGNYIYGSSGDFGPSFLTAIDVNTGKAIWQDRSFPKVNFVYADGKLVMLDEDGNLALATPTPEGLKVHSKVALMTNRSWTAPTLAGTRLYVRDRKTIVALDLK
ncbi:MAG TPA: PQQ-binding-like beta-propeller repeat protein [Blastocatellia bacterium]|nr:PQQ-binding-like beta-propeller repeat protein [Blastocatellia bacterium]